MLNGTGYLDSYKTDLSFSGSLQYDYRQLFKFADAVIGSFVNLDKSQQVKHQRKPSSLTLLTLLQPSAVCYVGYWSIFFEQNNKTIYSMYELLFCSLSVSPCYDHNEWKDKHKEKYSESYY